MTEDNDGDIDLTEDRQFVSLLEETAFSLEEGTTHPLAHDVRYNAPCDVGCERARKGSHVH